MGSYDQPRQKSNPRPVRNPNLETMAQNRVQNNVTQNTRKPRRAHSTQAIIGSQMNADLLVTKASPQIPHNKRKTYNLTQMRDKVKMSMMSNYYKNNFLPQKMRFKVSKLKVLSNVFPLSDLDIKKDRKQAIIDCIPKFLHTGLKQDKGPPSDLSENGQSIKMVMF